VVALATEEGMAVMPEIRRSERRHGGPLDDLRHDPVRGQFLGLRLIRQSHPVAEDIRGEFLDERRPDKVLAAEPREGPARLVKGGVAP